jgi:hypothetical protein
MRHVAFTTRWILAASAAVTVAWSGGVALARSSQEAPRIGKVTQEEVHDSRELREEAECWGGPAPTTTLPQLGGVTQTIMVTVERVAILKLDSRGKVKAAETNTGCAPHAGDRIYIVQADGSLVEAPKFDLERTKWTGDFRNFGFIPQD